MKLTYEARSGDFMVFRGEVRVGTIMKSAGGYRFFPYGGQTNGKLLTLEALKKKIEKEYAK